MKFWISGEVMADVADDYRETRKEVERRLNAALDKQNYGAALSEVVFIGIIRPSLDSAYPEVFRYNKRDRQVEARFRIDHDAFLHASRHKRRELLLNALGRAIDQIDDLSIDHDAKRLQSEFAAASREILGRESE